jgi:light-regulated signal transduction histidine kinase (bacteriophytochrome)
MVSGQGDETIAVEALKRGALDYFVKSAYPPTAIEASVLDAIRRTSSARRNEDRRDNMRSYADVMVQDLRDPLRAMQRSTAALRHEMPSEIREAHAENLDVVEFNIAQIARFLDVLQDYSACDGSDTRLEEVDLNAQVDTLRTGLRSELPVAKGRIERPEALPVILNDGEEIAHLLEHLVRNGIQFNRSDVPTVRITTRTHATHWSTDVTDKGIGIAPSDQERVFEPFCRLAADVSDRGAGLGLAMARCIAQRLGCRLTCSS